MTRPRVSIITAVRDGARTIGDAIASVRAQHEPSWEHLIVDDGSTDATAAIVAGVAEPRVRLIRRPHAGRSAARNHGLDVAFGRHFLFLDADDWLLPNAVADHLRVLDARPDVGASISDGQFCSDDGRPLVRFSARRAPLRDGDLLPDLVANPGAIGGSLAVMVRGAIVGTHQIRFDPDLDVGEDALFWIEVARHTPMAVFDAVTCCYRWHPDNTTRRLGVSARRAAAWRAFSRIPTAPYFVALPEVARVRFFARALLVLLVDDVEEQGRVIGSSPFASLAPARQARLLRLAASEHLLARRHAAARRLLDAAARLAPRDPTVRALRGLARLHPRLAGAAVRLRRLAQRPAPDPLGLSADEHRRAGGQADA